MAERKVFYTYIYLDPRKLGSYSYGDYTFEYEPFYVGKGFGKRCIEHILECTVYKGFKESFKRNKIKKILNENLEPIILKVEENLNEQEALDLEIWLIWAIGRSDLKLGPLTNHTDGGDGVSGIIQSQEHRMKNSLSKIGKPSGMAGKKLSEDRKIQISKQKKGKPNGWEGKKQTEQHKLRNSISTSGKNNPMYGKKHSIETILKISNSLKGNIPWNKGKKLSRPEEHCDQTL